MARRHKSFSVEVIGVCSSGTFPLGANELGKDMNFAQMPLSHTVEAEQADSAQGYVASAGRPCQSLCYGVVHQGIVYLLKQHVPIPHHG